MYFPFLELRKWRKRSADAIARCCRKKSPPDRAESPIRRGFLLFRVTDSAANTAETVHLLDHPDPEDALHAPQALHRLFGGVVV